MKKKTILSKRLSPNLQNLPFTEYYQSLPDMRNVPKGTLTPRLILLHAIEEVTGKSFMTIRRWVNGKVLPTQLEQDAIAELLACSKDVLFPTVEEMTV